ncbi:MAG TPA: sulfite exporter TauE/SafE family protein [Vicinamibacterales bacterium]|nr:sulfite exporter TauE/SafE family protein [Vicinamibacterales bacterium]
MNPITGLYAALGVLTVGFIGAWTRLVLSQRRAAARVTPATDIRPPSAGHFALGAATNFLDALGIGSFATTTTVFRLGRMVPDRIIPGTLNVGHTLPTHAQAFAYIAVIPADVLTLFSMIAAAVAGAWLGAGIVARWPKRKVQLGMSFALFGAAAFMIMRQLELFPSGGEAIGVRGPALAVGVAGNFILGALMTLGIGLYAPCMVLVSLLGMSERTAFPIMMGSCAFLMPIGGLRFIREQSYSLRHAVGLAIGGIPGVLVAAYIVKSLSLTAVRLLVIFVVLYTAIALLRSAFRESREADLAIEPHRVRTS